MKTKLLAKVRKGTFATKVKRFGFEMYKISSEHNGSDNGVYCISKKDAISILREMRLEAARNMMPKKHERGLRL